MASRWGPTGSSGKGPDAGGNNEPELVRGATPGQRDTGYQSIGDDAEKSAKILGRLTTAVSEFTSKISGDKRKLTEFTASITSLNTELEETIRLLDEAGQKSGELGGGGGGGLWTPASTSAGGVSYTKRQLPGQPGDVQRDVTRAHDLGDVNARRGGQQGPTGAEPGFWRNAGQTALIGAAIGSPFAMGNWFERQRDPTMMSNMQFNRMALTGGPSASQLNTQMQGQFEGGRFRSHEEFFATQQSLEQRGVALGGDTFNRAMEEAGSMRDFMPHHSTEALAGASAEFAHGQVGRELRMRGIIDWGASTEEVFRQILKRVSNTGQMPTAEVLKNANPGTAFYESIMVLTGGDVELTRMVIDWGRAEIASKARTGEQISLTREHAEAAGFTDTTEHAERQREAAASANVASRYDELADQIVGQHEFAKKVTDGFRSLGENIPLLNKAIVEMTGKANSLTGSMGGTLSTLSSLAGQFLMMRLALGKGLGLKGALGGIKAAGAWGAGKLGLGTAAATTGAGATTAAAGTTTAGTAATAAGGTALGTAATATGVVAAVGGASYLASRGMLAADDWLVERGVFEEDRYGDEGPGSGDVSDWDELDATAKQARDPQRYAREMGFTEPGGGPPLGFVEGADHDGPGYSTRGFGGVKPHVAQAGHYIDKKFGPFPGGIGGVGKRSGKSDHPRGLALDFMTMKNTKLGDRVAAFLQKNAKHFGVKYIIWKQRINSGDGRGWRKMEDRGSITANHFDHPHVSFQDAPGSGTGGFDGELSDFDDYGEDDRSAVTDTGFSSSALPSSDSSASFSSEEADILAGIFGGGGAATGTGGVGGSSTSTSPGYSDQGSGERPSVSGTGTISDTEIAKLARYGGWSGDELVTATAIALAESRGNPRGMGDVDLTTPGEKSVGLWQINWRPEYSGDPVRDPQANLDPHQNAKNAYRIYQRQGWGAWSVHPSSGGYTANNSYTHFLDRARQAVGAAGSGSTEPAGGLDMASSLSEGSPSGGVASMSVGGVPPTLSSSQTRQVNVKFDVKIERASREEAERLADMVIGIVRQEEGIEMVSTR